MTLNEVATAYVKLVLAVGEVDDGYVDAYYGPPEWRTEAHAQHAALPALMDRAQTLIAELARAQPDPAAADATPADPDLPELRKHYLRNQIGALAAQVRMLQGLRLSFDDETRALYDIDPPHYSETDFEPVLQELDNALPPGEGGLAARYNRYIERYAVPVAQLQTVMQVAITHARTNTDVHIALPPGEHFDLALVSGRPWSAYNWYQGGYASRIEVNTQLPVTISRVIDLASHEGYPGHHVYNALLERRMVRGVGAVEFSVYPLFSPQSFIAEGSADFGVGLAFPGGARLAMEQQLFQLAGFNPAEAPAYDRIVRLARRLKPVDIEAARRYLDGTANDDATIAWLQHYGLYSAERARQRLKFFDTYRSYVVNYAYGEELVRAYVEQRAGEEAGSAAQWQVFTELLSRPHVPGDLLK